MQSNIVSLRGDLLVNIMKEGPTKKARQAGSPVTAKRLPGVRPSAKPLGGALAAAKRLPGACPPAKPAGGALSAAKALPAARKE